MFVLALTASSLASAKTPEHIFEQVSASIVIVDVLDTKGEKIGHGSGVVVATGTVVTNCHVTDKATFLQVRWKDTVYSATLEYHHPYQDLCIVSAPDLDAPHVSLSATQNLKIGSKVFAIGAPRGLELTMSDGIVSGLRNVNGSVLIQTNAAISPGSSGGGLFNADGRLVGITTWLMRESQNLNFALSADLIPGLQAEMKNARSRREEYDAEREKLLQLAKFALEQSRRAEEEKARAEEEKRRVLEEKQKAEEEKKRVTEEKKEKAEDEKRHLQEERKKADEEKKEEKRKVEDERKREKEKEDEKKLTQEQREKLEMEKRAAEEKRKEDERKKQEDEKRVAEEKRKQDEGRAAKERAAKEGAERARQQSEAAKRLKDEYIAKIKAKIEQNTSAPEGMSGNPRAEFTIVLLPTGEVLSATLVKSSGNPAYDQAVERSIYKSAPLPVPPNNPELFREFRELRLPFTYVRR